MHIIVLHLQNINPQIAIFSEIFKISKENWGKWFRPNLEFGEKTIFVTPQRPKVDFATFGVCVTFVSPKCSCSRKRNTIVLRVT